MSLNLAVVIQVATTQVSYVIEPGCGGTGGHYTSENLAAWSISIILAFIFKPCFLNFWVFYNGISEESAIMISSTSDESQKNCRSFFQLSARIRSTAAGIRSTTAKR